MPNYQKSPSTRRPLTAAIALMAVGVTAPTLSFAQSSNGNGLTLEVVKVVA